MESKAKFLGHPVHPMLIVFPLGLLATAVIFDVIQLITRNSAFSIAAYWMIAAGLIGGLIAAPFGFIDWSALPSNSRARFIGIIHGIGNVLVLGLFFWSWILRSPDIEPRVLAMALSFAGAGLALVTAWLGGELVNRLGVGVYEDANVNAPNSLKKG